MLWAGSGLLWTVAGGVPRFVLIGSAEAQTASGFTFAQVSDSHLGFSTPLYSDVAATTAEAVAKLKSEDPLARVERLQHRPLERGTRWPCGPCLR